MKYRFETAFNAGIRTFSLPAFLLALGCALGISSVHADQFATSIKPLVAEHCVHCHEGSDANGGMDFGSVSRRSDLLGKPDMILAMLKAIDSYDMPPQDEPALDDEVRQAAVSNLKLLLREATAAGAKPEIPLRRLNRFHRLHRLQ